MERLKIIGLDNGITISRINRLSNTESIDRKIFIFDREDNNSYQFDFYTKILQKDDTIAYWRKCYNVRDAILNILKTDKEQYEYPISHENLLKIIKVLKAFNKRNWNDSIWEWRDAKHNIRKCIRNLNIIERYMRKNPNVIHLTFYDSY